MACAPSDDSDQTGHPPSLIRVFACAHWEAKDRSFFSYGQRRLRSDCADAQADLSLHWVHMPFCWFGMRWFIICFHICTVFIAYNTQACRPTYIFANSVDPDETAQFHLDLHYLQFCFGFCADTPIFNSGRAKIQRWKSPAQKLRVKRARTMLLQRQLSNICLIIRAR